LEEVDRREPEAGEVLVRVTASGMCHTELHFKSGLLDLGVAPVTMGHEVVGRIEEVGEGVCPDRSTCAPICAPSMASSRMAGTQST
jgi:D-arabinose 1-dehydrogenase-like Zn-dependent alcohol dehydrogenase